MTPKQERFVQEYLVDLNATQAAIRAGYSEKRASEYGYQLLQKTTVQNAIQRAMQEQQQRIHLDQDYVLGKLREIADMDASDASDSELKYSGKLKALELLGRHLGMFDDRMRLSAGPDTSKLDGILAQLWEPDTSSPSGPGRAYAPVCAADPTPSGGNTGG